MNSVLKEIEILRKREIPSVFSEESNPYTVTVPENDGSKTSYCFSIPIRNKAGELIKQSWIKDEDRWSFYGTNGAVSACGYELHMKNELGECTFILPDRYESDTEDMIVRNYSKVLPTLNGVCIWTRLGQGREYHLVIKEFSSGLTLKKNDKYVTLLTDSKNPFVTVSGIIFTTRNNIATGAVDILGRKIGKGEYDLTIKPKGPVGGDMYIDIHMNEAVLFRDSTVESLHPKSNNAFGSGAFLGMTVPFGEQWLYSEFRSDLIPQLRQQRIRSAIWHLPRHSDTNTVLDLFEVPDRFCDTDVNWVNKPSVGRKLTSTVFWKRYQDLDITPWIRDEDTQFLKDTYCMLLKTQRPGRRFTAISTADCNYAPQILEINFE